MSDINITVNDEIVNIDIVDEPVLVNVVNSPGVPGAPGVGVPVGGTTGQVLAKNSNTNYDTEWVDVSGGAWGTITGTLSNQTDLQAALDGKFDNPTGTTSQYLRGDGSLATFPSLTGYVPYTGATGDVNLGTHRIIAQNATISSSGSGDTVSLTHSSGSGIGLNITKGGNGEGLYINKTGGSGNAATIIGTLNATTLVKSGGTSTQYLMADGSVSTLTNPITGTGTSGQVSYWSGTSTQAGSNNLFWDNANGRLGIGTNTPADGKFIDVVFDVATSGGRGIRIRNINATGYSELVFDNDTTPTSSGGFVFGYAGTSTATADTAYFWNRRNAPILFGTNNTERMRIFGVGNVGIGTGSSDSGQRLQVQGTTLLNGNVTFSSSTGMTWDAANGRLGIGTSSPAYLLDISGTSRQTGIYYNTGYNIFVQRLGFNNGTLAANYGYIRAESNGVFSLRNASENDFTRLQFGGSTSSFPALQRVSNAIAVVDATGSGTSNLLVGSTTDSGERLQVTGTMKVTGESSFRGNMILNLSQNGNTKFELFNTTNGSASETSLVLTSSNGLFLFSKYSASKTAYKFVSSGDALMYNATNGNISILNDFATGTIKFGAGGSSTAHMTIKANGTINMSSLPTSPTGLSSGDLWNNLGILTIV
jgi:hypothetical protein